MLGFLTFTGSDTVHLLKLPRTRFTFGADDGRELTIKLPGLPGYCGSFTWNEAVGSWTLEVDGILQPRITIDDSPMRETSVVLDDGALINLDAVTLRFNLVPDTPMVGGVASRSITLTEGPVRIGRGNDEADPGKIVLDPEDGAASRLHALLEKVGDAWYVVDKSNQGTRKNGVLLVRERLVIGDRLLLGHYTFEFTGRSLRLLPSMSGGRLSAHQLSREVPTVQGKKRILSDVTLDVPAGSFIGILGCSGQGKSTLMTALCGLNPATSGTVYFDGKKLESGSGGQHRVGFVPQDDIVHTDLTVRHAITFSALLRLPEDPPMLEIQALVLEMANRLGLEPHLDKRISQLSGGQRKRVSIATELLSKPSMLFLDEPSSGLDPATEYYLMSLLRDLAGSDCTVLCTTHVLARAYLFDRVMFVHDGRLVFHGPDTDALQFFKKVNLDEVYLELDSSQPKDGRPAEGKPAVEWEKEFSLSPYRPAPAPLIPVVHDHGAAEPAQRPTWRRVIKTLLWRQWSILRSDRLNLGFLLAQAVAIALLIGWVTPSHGLRSFLSVVAVLWFGTSNAAQQIVSELAIFRRERVCGMGLHVYLQSKLGFTFIVTALQAALLFLIMHITALGVHGDAERWKQMQEDLTSDPRISGEQDEAGTEDNPGRGAGTLRRLFGLGKEESEHIAARFTLRTTAEGAVLDERRISLRAKERAKTMVAEGVPLKSAAAQEMIQKYFTPEQVPPVPAAEVQQGLGSVSQTLYLQLVRLFDLGENVRDSRQRQLQHEGDILLDEIGEPVVIPAKTLLSVTAIPLGLKVLALLAAALAGVGLGLAISALVRAPTQAVMWVPLLLIPQILLGGYVVTRAEMGSLARRVCTFVPSAAAERVAEVASIYGQTIPPMSNQTRIPAFLDPTPEVVNWTVTNDKGEPEEESQDYIGPSASNVAFQNLLVLPNLLGQRKIEEASDSLSDSVKERRDVVAPMGYDAVSLAPAWQALLVLLGWTAASYALAIHALRKKQPL
jgi:ABC-type multidrug transport system ATPase subunit